MPRCLQNDNRTKGYGSLPNTVEKNKYSTRKGDEEFCFLFVGRRSR